MSLFAGNMFDVFGGGFFTNSFYGNVYGGYAPKASIFEYMNGATDNSFMYNWYACMSNATTMQEENFCFAKFFNEGNWGRTSYTKPSRPNYENPPLIKQGPGGTYDAGSYVDDAIGKLEKGLATGNKKDIEHGYRDPKVFEEMSSNRNKAGYAFIDKLKEKLFEYSNERSGLVEEALDCLDDVDGVDDVEKLLAAILSPKVVLRAAAEGEKLDWNKILQNVSEADIKAFIFFVEGEAGNEINAAATGTDSAQPGAGDYLRAIAKKVKGLFGEDAALHNLQKFADVMYEKPNNILPERLEKTVFIKKLTSKDYGYSKELAKELWKDIKNDYSFMLDGKLRKLKKLSESPDKATNPDQYNTAVAQAFGSILMSFYGLNETQAEEWMKALCYEWKKGQATKLKKDLDLVKLVQEYKDKRTT